MKHIDNTCTVAYVYCIHDPYTLKRKYIGISVNPKTRVQCHINGVDVCTKNWVNTLDIPPVYSILEACSTEIAVSREQYHISQSGELINKTIHKKGRVYVKSHRSGRKNVNQKDKIINHSIGTTKNEWDNLLLLAGNIGVGKFIVKKLKIKNEPLPPDSNKEI